MMRSLSSGVTGLRSHQTKMDVIGNNIANVNTYGFKSSRTTFADVYYQNLGGASKGTTGVQGGKNPTQIGYGASVATIDIANSVSGASSTDFALDVYIAGDGFLVSKDTSGRMMYTRLGKLDFDSAGNLVDGNGNLIQGFPMGDNGQPQISEDGTIEASDLRAITCNPEILQKLKGISISSTGLIVGTLEGDKVLKAATVPDFIDTDSMSINKDSNYLGNVTLSIGALPSGEDMTSWFAGTSYDPKVTNVQFGNVGLPQSGNGVTYTMSVTGKTITLEVKDANDPKNSALYEGIVQEDGTVTLKSKQTGGIAMTFTVDKQPTGSTKVAGATVTKGLEATKYQMTTRDKGDNIVRLPQDGFGEPYMTIDVTGTGKHTFTDFGGISVTVDLAKMAGKPSVTVIGTATPDEDVLFSIGNIAIAKFPNPNGMEEIGSSYFARTSNSGDPVFVKPSIDGTGAMNSGYLEMSNVDVSKEFTDMITTQRGFQANSRIITVSDTMLEELVNLKR